MNGTPCLMWLSVAFAAALTAAAYPAPAGHGAVDSGLALSERLRKVQVFEKELAEMAKEAKVPGSLSLDYPVDIEPIALEAESLIAKYGETMEFKQLKYTRHGAPHGRWTCLSLKATNGDMCDDSNGRPYSSTPVWNEAPHIRKLLEPIEGAMTKVRFSIMHPATMVNWHCDDCPHGEMQPAGCPLHKNRAKLHKKWNKKFHNWVRLHLMLSNTDVASSYGGHEAQGTSSGGFYLANVAMPHRVDNKGSSSRIALIVDVNVHRNRLHLGTSPLGRSILAAVKKLKDADAAETYLKMGYSMYQYKCGLSFGERYETEWHSQAWTKAFWRPPLPPFQANLFNSEGRCGVLGPLKNKEKMEKAALLALPAGERKAATKSIASRRRRRRS